MAIRASPRSRFRLVREFRDLRSSILHPRRKGHNIIFAVACFNRVADERGLALPICVTENRVPKVVRIRRLTPLLARGRLRFKAGSPGARLLVRQLRDFPNGDHDDGPDALEMAVRLARTIGRQPAAGPPDPGFTVEYLREIAPGDYLVPP